MPAEVGPGWVVGAWEEQRAAHRTRNQRRSRNFHIKVENSRTPMHDLRFCARFARQLLATAKTREMLLDYIASGIPITNKYIVACSIQLNGTIELFSLIYSARAAIGP